ncbi:MAG TPA: L-threonylcarbamoyladenylate synthase [Burkholderiaceae bacterium]|mgnify:CR=1 FL=1|nr:L-threonylcarbamoyladenylate synthase [Burkholderiaceae bacterium]
MILDSTNPASITQAAECIASAGLVGMPTETVYGLAADANNPVAVAKIFAAKGRPSDHPLIVHVADAAQVHTFASEIPEFAHKLMQAFWPGPLTLILPRQPHSAAAAAGGQNSIGVRCPAHPVALALLHACADRGIHGLAAPSANQFGRVSPTTAQHVAEEFAHTAYQDMPILDGGACSVGIESTIIDCTRGAPVLLRPGVLTVPQLSQVCGQPVLSNSEQLRQYLSGTESYFSYKNDEMQEVQPAALKDAPRASGTLESHYAPRAKVRVMDAKELQSALDILGEDAQHIAVYSRTPLRTASQVLQRRMPNAAPLAAQQLFATLRELDQTAIDLIWIEALPDTPEWDGVRDRVTRAAA